MYMTRTVSGEYVFEGFSYARNKHQRLELLLQNLVLEDRPERQAVLPVPLDTQPSDSLHQQQEVVLDALRGLVRPAGEADENGRAEAA